ncbi:MAG: YCF48-related protein, partial [Ignavibacteriaceae bacterium]|nr:YCF48-related protein [Ignavibacteriaceae bacterium]
MKKYILLFLLSFCLNNFVNAQGWRKAYDTPISGIQAGYMADGNTIWLVGDNESIFKSTDGGFTWVEKFHTDNIDSYAHDISFVNSTTAFVGCDYGRILKTTDGGETWNVQLVPLPDSTYDVIQVHFFDSNLGFALCDSQSKAFIYKTTNGGIKWDT